MIADSSIQYAQVMCVAEDSRRVAYRVVILVLSVFLSTAGLTQELDTDKKVYFDIPRQRADLSLTQFAEQADQTLIFSYDTVRRETANRLVGRFPIEVAVEKLLAGTSLQPVFNERGMLTAINNSEEGDMSTGKLSFGRKVAGLFASIFVASGASAQETENSGDVGLDTVAIEEIIVTASKRETTLRETPYSVDALSQTLLEEANLRDMSDIITMVPGASEGLSWGAGLRNYQIRGIYQAEGDPTIGYYVDDAAFFVYGLLFAPTGRSFDMERVEVLRGPQSTLYGNGSMGGTVRFIPNAPNLGEIEGQVAASYSFTDDGDPGHYIDAAVSFPIVEDEFAVRLVGSFQEIGGYQETHPLSEFEEDYNDSKLMNLRAMALWKPNDELSIKFLYSKHEVDQDGGTLLSTVNPSVGLFRDDFNDTGYDLYSGSLIYDFGFASLTSTTTYIDFYQNSTLTFPFPLPGGILPLTQSQVIVADAINNETRLVSQGDGPFQWLVGAFYSDTEDTIDWEFVPAFLPPFTSNFRSEAISFFGEASYAFMDGKLTTLFGLRYFDDDRSSTDTSVTVQPPPDTFDSVNPRFNVSYQPSIYSHYYLNIAKGFRSGKFNSPEVVAIAQAAGVPAEVSLDSDELWSYEIGTKQALGAGRAQLDVAFYFMNWEDMNVSIPVSGLFQTYKIGDSEIYGLDFGLTYNPITIDGLSFQMSANWNSAEITDLRPEYAGAGIDINEGDRLPFVPEWTLSASSSYSWELRSGWLGQFFMSYSHIEPQYGQIGTPAKGESRDLLRARFGLEKDSFGAYLFGNNLLGEDGIIYSQEPAGGVSVYSQDYPQSIGIEVQYRF